MARFVFACMLLGVTVGCSPYYRVEQLPLASGEAGEVRVTHEQVVDEGTVGFCHYARIRRTQGVICGTTEYWSEETARLRRNWAKRGWYR